MEYYVISMHVLLTSERVYLINEYQQLIEDEEFLYKALFMSEIRGKP